MVVSFNGAAGTISISDQFAGYSGYGIEAFSFSGGPAMDMDEFIDSYLAKAAATDDVITGFDNRDDWIYAGGGDDILTGGSGSDYFIFTANSGRDRITDFDPMEDVILLEGLNSVHNWGDLLDRASEASGDVIISFDPENVLTLESFSLAQLSENNFYIG